MQRNTDCYLIIGGVTNLMLQISNSVFIPENEIEMSFIRARGAGGQNVNKVSSAVHLRFDIQASSLPDYYKDRLLAAKDSRITREGIIIIKAQRFRTQEKNREDALCRLKELICSATTVQKKRRPTRATRASKIKRMDKKAKRGQVKSLRGRINY